MIEIMLDLLEKLEKLLEHVWRVIGELEKVEKEFVLRRSKKNYQGEHKIVHHIYSLSPSRRLSNSLSQPLRAHRKPSKSSRIPIQ